jgi:hypothetical protein
VGRDFWGQKQKYKRGTKTEKVGLYQHVDRSGTKTEPEIQKEILTEMQKTTSSENVVFHNRL